MAACDISSEAVCCVCRVNGDCHGVLSRSPSAVVYIDIYRSSIADQKIQIAFGLRGGCALGESFRAFAILTYRRILVALVNAVLARLLWGRSNWGRVD